jgi:hypothetical protein
VDSERDDPFFSIDGLGGVGIAFVHMIDRETCPSGLYLESHSNKGMDA